MADFQENIGAILKYLRQDRNLAQKEVCAALNVTEQAYSNYETGRRTPNLSIIKKLAVFYHIDIGLFLTALCPVCPDTDAQTAAALMEEDYVFDDAAHPLAITKESFILLDQYRRLGVNDQKDLLLYTKIKSRRS